MPPETASQPANFEPGEYSQFMLRTHAEILVVLRGLCERISQITVFFNEGRDMLMTTIAAVADDHLVLDFGPGGEMNRKALEARKHFCVTTLDKVRVQFILREFGKTEHEGRPAFRCALPDEVLRLQRREFYRLTAPIAHPIRCVIPVKMADGSKTTVETTVIDISGGGLGVMAPPEGLEFETDHLFENCRIELPDVGTVLATLRVRNVFEFTLRSGAKTKRAGCQFVDLPGQMLTLIQRYIIRVERERKARETGML
jgi:c-di-GMP-binding flagellar brake protein YcgR